MTTIIMAHSGAQGQSRGRMLAAPMPASFTLCVGATAEEAA